MASESLWSRRFRRLQSMSRKELADRTRQHVTARLDAYRYKRGYDFAAEWSTAEGARTGRFFFGPSDVPEICEGLRQRFPSSVAAILSGAEKICRHQFDLLGYQDLDYGAEIDWHLDLVHEKRGPKRPWFQIGYLNFAEVGDAKITWELNRHQHLVTLAKAYRLSGDEKFANEILAQWNSWQAANPYPIGMNWASSLEVAFRSLSWTWTYFLLEQAPVMTAGLRREWVRALGLSGRHIETYLSTYFSPNTHLLGEAVALFFLGSLFPEFSTARRWQERGWQVILEAARKQVRNDGFYFEQSTYYHVYALDFFLHARVLAILNGIVIPADFDAILIKMLDALCLLARAGTVPSLGDDDGGRVFDPRRNRAEHLPDPLGTGAVLFERGDFKFFAGTPREEMLWLLGPPGLTAFDELETKLPSDESVALKESGLYLMADPEMGLQAVIDAGPHGPGSAGHGHADALSLTLIGNGRSLLLDPGTLQYVSYTPQNRQRFRGTAAHNTLCVDGVDQADGAVPFAWKNLPTVKADRWLAGKSFNLFSGSHDGYERLSDPVTHQRWVFHRKSQFWLVRDLAKGKGKHSLQLSWHLGANLSTESAKDHVFGDGQGNVGFVTAESHGWSQNVERTSWSPAYGRRERTTTLTFGTETTLPAEFVTLLLPSAGLHPGIGRLQKSATEAVSSYRYSRAGEEHSFFFADSQGRWTVGSWSSDAKFLYWGSNRAHGEQVLVLCDGSYAEVAGQRILASPSRVDYAEVVGMLGRTELFSSEPDQVQLQGSLERVEAELATSENDPKRIGV